MNINSVNKVIYKKEISIIENFYRFFEMKKLVVFVPDNFTEKLAFELSRAGAGEIGNYSMCSFRTNGTGTFLPVKKANPFSGIKNKLTFENEVKLEMECRDSLLNKVIDVLMKFHPYEEVAYEIYSFVKRSEKAEGFYISLKKEISYCELFRRINPRIENHSVSDTDKFSKIIITGTEDSEDIIRSAKLTGSSCLLILSKNNNKLYKL